MAKNESTTPPAVKNTQDLKTRDELAVQESQVGGLTPNPTRTGPLANDPETLKKAFSPAGDTGKQSTSLDDPSKPGRLDPVEVAKGHTTVEGGAESQTSPALTGAGTDGEPDLPPPAKEKVYRPKEFRVKNPQRITVSWKGLEVRLDPGAVISEDSYGDNAIEQFRQAGLLLEEVKTEEELRAEKEAAEAEEKRRADEAEEKRLLSLKNDETKNETKKK